MKWLLAAMVATTVLVAEERVFELGPGTGLYDATRGFGYDLGTDAHTPGPHFFSVNVAEGNWRVTVTLGDDHRATNTTIKAESRRLMLEAVQTAPGEIVEREFVVNVRTPALPAPPKNAPGGTEVRLNDREAGVLHWDNKLTLEINGSAPAVRQLRLEPAPQVTTVYLLGDSTVTDQPYEPGASWGQMLPRFFGPNVAVANHAESGETLKSFLTGLRFDKVLSTLKAGDCVFLQFGHNDSKDQWPQTHAEAGTTYNAYLRAYLAEIRRRGAQPVLVTPVHRRVFDGAEIRNTHGGYIEAVKAVAEAEGVPCIDLAKLSAQFYEALGPEEAPAAFSDGGKDPTHHNAYGAYQLARFVADAIRQLQLPLASELRDMPERLAATRPQPVTSFHLPLSPHFSRERPRGD